MPNLENKIKEIIECTESNDKNIPLTVVLDQAFKANHVKMVLNDSNRHEEWLAKSSITSAILDSEIAIYENKYGEYVADHTTFFDDGVLLEDTPITDNMTRRACLKYLDKHLLVIDETQTDKEYVIK